MPSEALDARGVRRGGREAVERAGGTLLRERPQPVAVCALSARQALPDVVLGVSENAVRAGQAVLRGDLHRPAATMCGCPLHKGHIAARAPQPPVADSVKHVVHRSRHCAGEVVEVDSPSPTRRSHTAWRRRGSMPRASGVARDEAYKLLRGEMSARALGKLPLKRLFCRNLHTQRSAHHMVPHGSHDRTALTSCSTAP